MSPGAYLDTRGQRHSQLGHGIGAAALLSGAPTPPVWPRSVDASSLCNQGGGLVWMEGRQGLSMQSYLRLQQSVELVATLVQEFRLF